MEEGQDNDNEDFCYICFEGATRNSQGEVEPLVQVCRCPTRVHRRCVARWQLYSAGKTEERTCRFCKDTLPDWKEVLTPRALPPAIPVLSIYYNNTCCRMRVRPGPDGLQAFLRQLEMIVGRDVADVNFVFRCRCPDTGAEIFLQGLQAFEAAMHCACVRAAQRSLQQQAQQAQQALQARQAAAQHLLVPQQGHARLHQLDPWQRQAQQQEHSRRAQAAQQLLQLQPDSTSPPPEQPGRHLVLRPGASRGSLDAASPSPRAALAPRVASAPFQRSFLPGSAAGSAAVDAADAAPPPAAHRALCAAQTFAALRPTRLQEQHPHPQQMEFGSELLDDMPTGEDGSLLSCIGVQGGLDVHPAIVAAANGTGMGRMWTCLPAAGAAAGSANGNAAVPAAGGRAADAQSVLLPVATDSGRGRRSFDRPAENQAARGRRSLDRPAGTEAVRGRRSLDRPAGIEAARGRRSLDRTAESLRSAQPSSGNHSPWAGGVADSAGTSSASLSGYAALSTSAHVSRLGMPSDPDAAAPAAARNGAGGPLPCIRAGPIGAAVTPSPDMTVSAGAVPGLGNLAEETRAVGGCMPVHGRSGGRASAAETAAAAAVDGRGGGSKLASALAPLRGLRALFNRHIWAREPHV